VSAPGFPPGQFEPEWRDRRVHVANVLFVRDPSPRWLGETFFRTMAPRWRAAGVNVMVDADAPYVPWGSPNAP
jgi:hypothetical protein